MLPSVLLFSKVKAHATKSFDRKSLNMSVDLSPLHMSFQK